MATKSHLKILKQGVDAWNQWRMKSRAVVPDLSGADLTGAILIGANLIKADLSGANLSGAELVTADLRMANLFTADLSGANLSRAMLLWANLLWANLSGANVARARVGGTIFVDIDLSKVNGLDTLFHFTPSSIGIDTIYRSGGNIPEVFLKGAGVPDDFITYMKSLVGKPIEYFSCFISYSHKDEEFTKRLHSRMRDEGLRTWYAPEDVKGGRKIHEQIDEAIRLYDKLLIVLSENSMDSEWVKTEIRKARQKEIREGRRVLFPIRLVDMKAIKEWECFDAETGKDLAVEIREYYIPDFQHWKDHDAFEKAFQRLLGDLKEA